MAIEKPENTSSELGRITPRALVNSDIGPWMPVVAFVVLFLFFSLLRPDIFPTTDNLQSILNSQAVLAIMAVGLTVVLLTGEFDLSIGAVMSMAGALSAGLVSRQDLPTYVVILVVIVGGAFVGWLNGVLVMYFEVPALIATLAIASILDGLTFWYTRGQTIFQDIPQDYINFGRASLGPVKVSIIYMLVVAIAVGALLRYTAAGRSLHAIGGNRGAAEMSGIRVRRYVILAFVVAGVLAAFAGVIQASRNGSASPQFGASFLLPAFAAAFLGSATIRRGEFHVLGTIIGVYLIATGTTGFFILGAPFWVEFIFSGIVLIAATAGSRFFMRRR